MPSVSGRLSEASGALVRSTSPTAELGRARPAPPAADTALIPAAGSDRTAAPPVDFDLLGAVSVTLSRQSAVLNVDRAG